MFCNVILPLPLDGTFTYSVPPDLESQVGLGIRVLVPFGTSKSYVGIVLRTHSVKPEGYTIKPIKAVMDENPIVTEAQLKLWEWISDYYMSPIGEVLKAAIPSGLKAEEGYKPRTETYIRLTEPYRHETALHVALNLLARAARQQEVFISYLALSRWDTIEGEETAEPVLEITREELMNSSGATLDTIKAVQKKGFLETYEMEVSRLNRGGDPHPELIKKMSQPQQEAFNQVLFSFLKKRVTLLHGVTSSGKTEIYIHLIQREIDQHRQVLYLLPEIALTVQIMERLQRVFGSRLGIYHSKYSDAERVEIWQKQLSAHPYDVILGARSAVFLPFQRLGLVIVDEEHETSYKQQDPAPRYHARSVAIMMGAPVLLGTATPSAESYHNAKTGKYSLVELKERYQGIELPRIEVVDTQELQKRKMMNGPFSPLLLARVREALEHGEQALLFQNRRGWAPMVECNQCGWVPRCDNCDVSLTLHRSMNQLTCHYCGHTYSMPAECPACGSKDLRGRGFGTEKIEDQIRDIFPTARIARMDLDTTRTRQAYERIIGDFSAGRTNLLIGTQMISKGLDFDRVSVVGILNADSMLSYPDFRAYEQAFTMMAQVSGRAGRKGKRGLVILQTKQPKLPLIDFVVRNDYASFYSTLAAERQLFHYPPYHRLIYIFLKHKKDTLVETAGLELATRLRQWFGGRVLGPDKPPVARIKTLSIRKIVLKLEAGLDMKLVRQYLHLAQQQMLQDKRYASLQLYYDVDPL
ncbi:MAG: primosomal protein N' [Prevotella sp.]|nr:primosomal protein N' [Prevotella sp.]